MTATLDLTNPLAVPISPPSRVIILAGGSITGKLTFLKSRCSSPALIPVNTRPLAAYLIDYYTAQGQTPISLAVNADMVDTVRTELGNIRNGFEIFGLRSSDGVVDSLAQVVDGVSCGEETIVNLVTTIPTAVPAPQEALVARELTKSPHWAGVVIEKDRVEFSLKSAPLPTSSHAFTGLFRCKTAVLKEALKATEIRNDLLALVEKIHSIETVKFVQCEWLDCGHETHYYEAKARLISSRSFNTIQVSLSNGVIRKSSLDRGKFGQEINYVAMLPADISIYFPRILTRIPNAEGQLEAAEMEFYGYPTVAEYLLYWDLSRDNWIRIFQRLGVALTRFRTHPYSISRGAFDEFYLGKTIQRIQDFFSMIPSSMRIPLEGETIVNGRPCRPFTALLNPLSERLDSLYRDQDFCIMHGDFCFNNILYDVPSGIVRLIDPRGSFGHRCIGIYGDQKYDLAKLFHSAVYGYDLIVNGLFSLQQNRNQFTYELVTRECSEFVATLARETVASSGYAIADVELLTSLLFLSMCPLHAENKMRQLIFYVHGLRLLNACLDN